MQQNVFRLDVAMNHAVPMRVVESARYFGGDSHRVGDWKLLFPVETLPQRFALDIRHHVVRPAAQLAVADQSRVDQTQDVRMLQVRGDFDFVEESIRAQRRGDLGVENLDGDFAFVFLVVREEHGCHSATTQLTFDRVATA